MVYIKLNVSDSFYLRVIDILEIVIIPFHQFYTAYKIMRNVFTKSCRFRLMSSACTFVFKSFSINIPIKLNDIHSSILPA